jgi:uncharacterized protein YdaU (DUF1376 family)
MPGRTKNKEQRTKEPRAIWAHKRTKEQGNKGTKEQRSKKQEARTGDGRIKKQEARTESRGHLGEARTEEQLPFACCCERVSSELWGPGQG